VESGARRKKQRTRRDGRAIIIKPGPREWLQGETTRAPCTYHSEGGGGGATPAAAIRHRPWCARRVGPAASIPFGCVLVYSSSCTDGTAMTCLVCLTLLLTRGRKGSGASAEKRHHLYIYIYIFQMILINLLVSEHRPNFYLSKITRCPSLL
jgi:hypothetical protein